MRVFHVVNPDVFKGDQSDDITLRIVVAANTRDEAIDWIEWDLINGIRDDGWFVYDMGEYNGEKTSAFIISEDLDSEVGDTHYWTMKQAE